MTCEACGLEFFPDYLFNLDMERLGSPRRRVRCFNDHGLVLNGEAVEKQVPTRLCMECAKPMDADAPEGHRYHLSCRSAPKVSKGRGRGKFKAGFLPVSVDA